MKTTKHTKSRLDNFSRWLPVVMISTFAMVSLSTIGSYSLWHDEGYTAVLTEGSFQDIISRTAKDVHPPLYYLLLKIWSLTFGDSIISLRLFSLTTMTLAIFIAYRIFQRIASPGHARWAMFGMVLGSYILRYSQEMRMYGLGALIAMSATYTLIRSQDNISQKHKLIWYSLYGLLITAGIYTQYFLILILPAHGLWFIVNNFKSTKGKHKPSIKDIIAAVPKQWILAIVGSLVLFLPWLPTMLSQFAATKNGFWIGPIKIETFVNTLTNIVTFQQSWELEGWLAIAALVSVVLTIYALLRYWPSTITNQTTRLLVLTVSIPTILLIFLSLPPMTSAYQVRYISFYSPLLYGAIGIIIGEAWRHKSRALSIFIAISLGVGTLNAIQLGNDYDRRPTPVFRMNDIAKHIRDNMSPQDIVVSTSLGTFFDAYYTLRDTTTTKLIVDSSQSEDKGNWSAVAGKENLLWRLPEAQLQTSDIPRGQRIWIISDDNDTAANAINSSDKDNFLKIQETFTAGHQYVSLVK